MFVPIWIGLGLFQKYGNKFGVYSKNMAINLENDRIELPLQVEIKNN